jgi:hypothetical protein
MASIQIRIHTEVIHSFVYWNVLNKQADYGVTDVSKQHSQGSLGSRYVEQFLEQIG